MRSRKVLLIALCFTAFTCRAWAALPTIVVGRQATAIEQNAARELQKCLYAATGSLLPIAGSAGGDAIAVCLASSATVKLNLDKVTVGDTLAVWWTNPATGEERSAGTFDRQARSFTPPADWGEALLHVAAPKRTPK